MIPMTAVSGLLRSPYIAAIQQGRQIIGRALSPLALFCIGIVLRSLAFPPDVEISRPWQPEVGLVFVWSSLVRRPAAAVGPDVPERRYDTIDALL